MRDRRLGEGARGSVGRHIRGGFGGRGGDGRIDCGAVEHEARLEGEGLGALAIQTTTDHQRVTCRVSAGGVT